MVNFSDTDFEETKELGKLLAKIDSITLTYAKASSQEMSQYQPFLISILLGYQFDLSVPQVDEVLKIYLLMWEYFKDKKNTKKFPITQEQFEQAGRRNRDFLHYLEGETTAKGILEVTAI